MERELKVERKNTKGEERGAYGRDGHEGRSHGFSMRHSLSGTFASQHSGDRES